MATLIYHVRTHTENKPYLCPLPRCEFKTATKGGLKHHLLSNQHQEQMTLELLNDIMSWDTKRARPETRLHRPRESTSTYRAYESTHNKRRHSNLNMMSMGPMGEMMLPPMKRMRYSQGIYGTNMMIHPTNVSHWNNGEGMQCVPMNALPMDWTMPPLPGWASMNGMEQYPSFNPGAFAQYPFMTRKSTAPTAKYYNMKTENQQNQNGDPKSMESCPVESHPFGGPSGTAPGDFGPGNVSLSDIGFSVAP